MPHKNKEERILCQKAWRLKNLVRLREKGRLQMRLWRMKRTPAEKRKNALWMREYWKIRRLSVLKAYSSELKCAHCGFSKVKALQLDHIKNNGAKDRKRFLKPGFKYSGRQRGGSSLIVWIIKNNFPKGYQVLCANCNILKFDNYYTRRKWG